MKWFADLSVLSVEEPLELPLLWNFKFSSMSGDFTGVWSHCVFVLESYQVTCLQGWLFKLSCRSRRF